MINMYITDCSCTGSTNNVYTNSIWALANPNWATTNIHLQEVRGARVYVHVRTVRICRLHVCAICCVYAMLVSEVLAVGRSQCH